MNQGAEDSFLREVATFRGALRLHCYRMLGSSIDGEDILQEVLLRAWRAKDTLADRAMLKPWLYRIATNACLDELKRRPRRGLASDLQLTPDDPGAGIAPHVEEPVWLEPMPNAWLQGEPELDPASRVTLKESVALAFVAALHALSAAQRATLLLRDVVGFSAEEAAEALGVSVAAANSSLFRARSAVDKKLGGRDASDSDLAGVDEVLVARYVRAWESADLGALVALLREDVETTMPPSPTWIAGRQATAAFLGTMFKRHVSPPIAMPPRMVPTGANGQPAFALYRSTAPGQPYHPRALQAIEVQGGAIRRIDHFMIPALFTVFSLPSELAWPQAAGGLSADDLEEGVCRAATEGIE